MIFRGTVLILVIPAMMGCSLGLHSQLEEKDRRISELEKQVGESEKQASTERKLRYEVEKQQSRILACHRDFRGSYGVLIERRVRLVRETQETIRYNCAGQITSQENETVTEPRESLDLPELKFLNSTSATIIDLNRQTCHGGGFRRAIFSSNAPTLWVNRSNAWLTHEVFDGENWIDFGLCDASGKTAQVSTDCGTPTWVGTLHLVVDSEERRLPGLRSLRPSDEQCAREAQAKK